MIIQVHTSEGIITLDTGVNSDEEFAAYGLTKEYCLNSSMFDGCAIRVYEQDTEPDIGDRKLAMWIDTNDSNKTYLIFRRGEGDQVLVELT